MNAERCVLCGENLPRARAAWGSLNDEQRASVEAAAASLGKYPKGGDFDEEGRLLWAWLYARDVFLWGNQGAEAVEHEPAQTRA